MSNKLSCIVCGLEITADGELIIVMNVDENLVGTYGVYLCSEKCHNEYIGG